MFDDDDNIVDTETPEEKAAKLAKAMELLASTSGGVATPSPSKPPTGTPGARLRRLEISSKLIDDAKCCEIAALVARHETLEVLDLSENSFGDYAASLLILASSRKRSPLHTLNLAHNGAIGKTSGASPPPGLADAIPPALLRPTTAERPKTRSTSASPTQPAPLAVGLGMSHVAEAVRNSSNLTSLDVSFCSLPAAAAGAVISAIEGTAVTSLNVSNNLIGPRGASAVAAALATNDTIARIDLSFSGLGDVGVRTVFGAIRSKAHLVHVDLSYNGLTSGGVAAVLDDIRDATALQSCSFEDTDIDEEVLEAVAKALAVNARFKPARPEVMASDGNTLTARFVLEPKVQRITEVKGEMKAAGHPWAEVLSLHCEGGVNIGGSRDITTRIFGVSPARTYILRLVVKHANGVAASSEVAWGRTASML
eukprot:TRINITY_DN69728_c0_g1_i1.p1 TRINITY_DN69728_c0_g1~~TRINITY_DN69728_c0_g1_i1.p1  ORF type:complete len:471 (+),score=121.18 TRINITY_DN69728_c0_g1_i1:139-1413(+)